MSSTDTKLRFLSDAGPAPAPTFDKKHVIIDTDVGVDDAHAIVAAFAFPDRCQVEAITCVNGNCTLDKVLINVPKVLDAVDAPADFPFYAGATKPLLVESTDTVAPIHGDDGMGDAEIPASTRTVSAGFAPDVLIDMANARPGYYSLILLGPLTNLALAVLKDPTIASKFRDVTVMGGAYECRGNVTMAAEFNFWVDPEAAQTVLAHFHDVVLASWELTLSQTLSWDFYNRWMGASTKQGQFLKKVTAKFAVWKESMTEENPWMNDGFSTADPTAIAACLFPESIKEQMSRYMCVETGGTYTRGASIVDWNMRKSGHKANVHIVTSLDDDWFRSMLLWSTHTKLG